MIKITNYGHSCFEINLDGYSIITDPYQVGSVPNLTLPKDLTANFVHCSHDHFDHNASNLIKIIAKKSIFSYEDILVPHDDDDGKKRGFNNIFIIHYQDFCIVHLGDIGCLPSKDIINKIKNCDILLAPINGFYTIGSKQVKELYDLVKPGIIIPMHYYKEYNNSGYPDGNQIGIFKKLFTQYLEVNSSFDFEPNLPFGTAVIFK